MSDNLQIDNYDKDTIRSFEEHTCPQEMTKNNQATQEELLQQEGLK